MKKWSTTIEIHAPIENVWHVCIGPLHELKKIMPSLIEHRPIDVTENKIGSIYLQKHKDGRTIMEYYLEITEYTNCSNEKKMTVRFTMYDLFEVTATYTLEKVTPTMTQFTYTTTNRPVKWYGKLLLLFSTSKGVNAFAKRVKAVAEAK